MMMAIDTTETVWRVRPFLLAAIGALVALIVHHLLDTALPPSAWQTALGCGIAIATFAFGFSLERARIGWVVGFAVALGSVAGLILYWNQVPQMGTWSDWRYLALLLALVVPMPLFQVANAHRAWRFPYAEVHAAAWTDVVLWCACWAFAGIAFALAWLLAGLFGLIGLHFLRDLLGHGWAVAMLFGAAFGGALGLLRERAGIVLLLQRVVTAVLGVLAPVLAMGLVLFLCALPFTGLGALWEATKSTTPILLACVIGALILANAVIGNGSEDEATNPLLRYGAMALATAMLPLAAIAALATALRIWQYGYSPDRLWALVFVILATVYAVAYVGSVLRGRRDWAGFARDANLKLAFVVAGVALVLATPLLSFNAISTRDQVARLESGRVSPDKFDWAALAFDFGESGKAAAKRLTGSGNAAIRSAADDALAAPNRWSLTEANERRTTQAVRTNAMHLPIIVRPVPTDVPIPLRRAIFGLDGDDGRTSDFVRTSNVACDPALKVACHLFWRPGDTVAVVMQDACAAFPRDKQVDGTVKCAIQFDTYRLIDGAWQTGETSKPSVSMTKAQERASLLAERHAIDRGDVSVRTVTRRQLFVGGKPVGPVME